MRNKALQFTALLLAALMLSGCAQSGKTETITVFAFDTVMSVTVDAADFETAQDCVNPAYYEALFSRTLSGSEVKYLNDGESIFLTDHTAILIGKALEYEEFSGGLFEPMIGALSELWNVKNETTPPSEDAIHAALSTLSGTITDEESENGYTCHLTDGAKLDLGGIAKGYTADMIASNLRSKGITSALIDFGGDCLTVGAKPDGSPWRVGIQKPFAPKGECVGYVEISDLAAATSGVYERYFEYEGTQYHHILDPRTGYPADTDLQSATVIAPSACDADALATICVLMGSHAALEFIESLDGIECILICGDGTILQSAGADFTAY